MKTEPTDIDREAAGLFKCVDGMRAGWCYTSVTSVPPKNRCIWERICSDDKVPDALDTDDPATVGCMLAQVEALAGPVVLIWDAWKDGITHYVVRYLDKWSGPTRGAALVAAKRALAEAAK